MLEHQDVQSLCFRDLFFALRIAMSLTEEERRSVEEEKQLFLNEIGLDEDSLAKLFKAYITFTHRTACATTDEERQSIEEEKSLFLRNYKTTLEYFARKKTQNSIPPAA